MSKLHKTAQQIYELLKNENWDNEKGKIVIDLLGSEVLINDKSIVGNALQDWLGDYLDKHNIYYRIQSNSQEFPDFFLNDDDESGLLELKTFDYSRTANFDIANFEAYCESIETKQYRLDADYLILAYTLENGILQIKNMWLKKIWEIASSSERFPVKCQVKRDMIYNIRPSAYSSWDSKNHSFNNKEDFVRALYETRKTYSKTAKTAEEWYKKVMIGLL